jgi:hypothetical protein
VSYPWHPLHGQRVRVYGRKGRAGCQILYIEVRPGLSREIPEWMCDTAICAAITSGSARVAIAGLIELRAVLDNRSIEVAADRSSTSSTTTEGPDEMSRSLPTDARSRGGGRPRPPKPAPEELLKALGDLLIEAFGNQNNVIAAEREACDAFQDHA